MTLDDILLQMNAEALKRGFLITLAGDCIELKCRNCNGQWSLAISSGHVGNMLSLLNHERRHRKKSA